jgi:lysophospholipase L1-like esterase
VSVPGPIAIGPELTTRKSTAKNHKNIELEFENQLAYIVSYLHKPKTRTSMKKLLCLIAILALVSPCFANPIRIMVFGDSLSWGFIPNEGRPSERYPVDSRWPGVLQKELGGEYEVIDEALNGRTTDASDNQLAGAGLDGSAYLPAAITSHHPLDLVIIMLGGNDLKAAYNRTPYRIALGRVV